MTFKKSGSADLLNIWRIFSLFHKAVTDAEHDAGRNEGDNPLAAPRQEFYWTQLKNILGKYTIAQKPGEVRKQTEK